MWNSGSAEQNLEKCRTNSVKLPLTLATEMDFPKTFENYGHVGALVKHCELKITFDAHLISRLNACLIFLFLLIFFFLKTNRSSNERTSCLVAFGDDL